MNTRRGGLAFLLTALVMLAGCGSGATTTTTTATTTTATTTTTTTTTSRACADLLASVDAFNNAIAHPSAHDQLQAAATRLAESIGATVTSAVKRADADAALHRLVTAATAQPPDATAMRRATNDLLTALQDAVRVCGSPPTSP